jgi:hypothetical protein
MLSHSPFRPCASNRRCGLLEHTTCRYQIPCFKYKVTKMARGLGGFSKSTAVPFLVIGTVTRVNCREAQSKHTKDDPLDVKNALDECCVCGATDAVAKWSHGRSVGQAPQLGLAQVQVPSVTPFFTAPSTCYLLGSGLLHPAARLPAGDDALLGVHNLELRNLVLPLPLRGHCDAYTVVRIGRRAVLAQPLHVTTVP